MVKAILDGANIQNCGDSNEVQVPRFDIDLRFGSEENLNQTYQISQPDELNNVQCRPGFTGPRCETVTDICLAQEPCENGGSCQPNGTSFVCNCPLHFTGEYCQYSKFSI